MDYSTPAPTTEFPSDDTYCLDSQQVLPYTGDGQPVEGHPAFQATLRRVQELAQHRLPGVLIEQIPSASADRIDVQARLGKYHLGNTFFSYKECRDAWRKDPWSVSDLDQIIRCWLTVLDFRQRQMFRSNTPQAFE